MPMILSGQDIEDMSSKSEAPTEVQVDFQESKAVHEESKKRIGAKRKPEKSRIVRVRKSDDEDALKCGYCFSEMLSVGELKSHEQMCRRSPLNITPRDAPSPVSEYAPDIGSGGATSQERNKSNERPSSRESASGCNQVLKLLHDAVPQMNGSQQLALEMILNAQMSLSRMASNYKEKDLSETLPLPQHHLLQLQLIQLLQAQLTMNNNNNSTNKNINNNKRSGDPQRLSPDLEDDTKEAYPHSTPSSKHFYRDERNSPQGDVSMSPRKNLHEEEDKNIDAESEVLAEEKESPVSSASSNISQLVIQHSESPPPSGLNTLEMLQKTADEVLNNATKGLLASRLIDSCIESDSKDPDARHRCRYCAKIFNSDSALQIHIRSHTGERPFKCNICGNRFTTKGNLKVHFQRHTDRFPHIKMNGHPVPEHLDKFYPPILQQLGELGENSPQSDGAASHPSFPLSPTPSISQPFKALESPSLSSTLNPRNVDSGIFKSPIDGVQKGVNKENDRFLDFRLQFPHLFPAHTEERKSAPLDSDKNEEVEEKDNNSSFEDKDEFDCSDIKKETESEHEDSNKKKEDEETNTSKKKSYQDHTIDSLLLSRRSTSEENDVVIGSRNIYKDILNFNENFRRDLENSSYNSSKGFKDTLSTSDTEDRNEPVEKPMDHYDSTGAKDDNDYLSDASSGPTDIGNNSKAGSTPPARSPIEFSHIPFLGMPLPPNLPILQGLPVPFPNHPGIPGSGLIPPPLHPQVDPARTPTIYSNLLPRPGSTDNSWEALIEIDKSNENLKVDKLIGKNKATEPNQCAICHRVLSCKSALHMHYRTHTGERPFKCRICGRAFTTKGNLKTHMSVHRAKPPMRMFHQCSVCHKKFSNGLILNQHIKLHTGEPTDLTPEQISVGEIRDFPGDIPFPMRFPHFQPNGLPTPIPPRNPFAPLPLSFPFYPPPKGGKREEVSDQKHGSPFSSSPRSSSTSSAEQQSAEDLSIRVRDEDSANNHDISRSVNSPTSSDYSDMDDKSPNLRNIPTSFADMHFSGVNEGPAFSTGLPLPPMSSPVTEASKSMFQLYPPLSMFSPIRPGFDQLQPPIPELAGNTTCKICFKVFACQSALEIHYRSHTKERPYKCTVCDRGFSTKGNMKQHMATHKASEFKGDIGDSLSSASPPSGMSSESKADSSEDLRHFPRGSLVSLSEEEKCDLAGKRERDPEKEGELTLPDPKRTLGEGAEGDPISPEEGFPPRRGGTNSGTMTTAASFHSPPLSSTSVVLPLPPTLSIPSSISHLPYPGRGGGGAPLVPMSLPLPFSHPLALPKVEDSLNL